MPVDEHGLDVDALERLLARHEVKLVALQTASHNPTGCDLAPDRARRLAELAMERNFFVLEDQVYADTRLEGERAAIGARAAPAHVIHVSSLSKVVGPGLRVGWVAARGRSTSASRWRSCWPTSRPPRSPSTWRRAGSPRRHDRHEKKTVPFYRAPRRADGSARAPPAGEYRRSRRRAAITYG